MSLCPPETISAQSLGYVRKGLSIISYNFPSPMTVQDRIAGSLSEPSEPDVLADVFTGVFTDVFTDVFRLA